MSFENDIKGKNIQIFPIVRIGNDTFTTNAPDEGHFQYYSTNSVSVVEKWGLGNSNRDVYCKPILLNIPSIKESVDIESRKFKISNVNLDFSNYPINGVRFSDQLSESSLINTEVSVYFKTVSTFEIPLGNMALFYGLGDADVNDFDKDFIMRVYEGQVRRISHDDEKVKIELEDLTEQKAHKDLPSNYIETETLPDKHKNKPIPIVYGNVDKSPLVFDIDESSDMLLIADENNSVSFESGNSLYIHESDKYITVPKEAKSPSNTILWNDSEGFTEATQYSDEGNFVELNSKITDADDDDENNSGNAIGDGKIVVMQKEYPTNFTALKTSPTDKRSYYSVKHDLNSVTLNSDSSISVGDEVGHNVMPLFIRGIMFKERLGHNFDDDGDEDSSRWQGQIPSEIVSEAMWRDEPAFDNSLVEHGWVGAKIDLNIDGQLGERNESYLFPHIKSSIWNLENWFGGDVDFRVRIGGNKQGDHHGDNGYIPFENVSYVGEFNIDGSGNITGVNWLPDLDEQPTINAITGNDDPIKIEHPSTLLFYMKISSNAGICAGQTEFIDLYVETYSLIKGVQDKEYYGDVDGRRNLFDDHPELGVNDTTFPYDDFIENPIDIIYDLVRSELGHDAINEDDYREAKDAHSDWVFGLTIDKKVNSKKLIEDIAKSTKCFPKFRNDGTFGFNTIKDSYSVFDNGTGDYETATEIKESEVINYSFKKTKPEQIYKKVDVQYKKDYAQDSFLEKTPTKDSGADPYYGIESSDEAQLEFESPYIRRLGTALQLRNFLEAQYRNDHLIFNLKLPLQYIELEIGDLVKFRTLLNGVKAYGIDYRAIDEPNGQTYYPLFMVTSTKKNLDSVEIECMQLHHLSGSIDSDWEDYGEDGEFYFPEHEPVYPNQSPFFLGWSISDITVMRYEEFNPNDYTPIAYDPEQGFLTGSIISDMPEEIQDAQEMGYYNIPADTYTVTYTVTDIGGLTETFSQQITVLPFDGIPSESDNIITSSNLYIEDPPQGEPMIDQNRHIKSELDNVGEPLFNFTDSPEIFAPEGFIVVSAVVDDSEVVWAIARLSESSITSDTIYNPQWTYSSSEDDPIEALDAFNQATDLTIWAISASDILQSGDVNEDGNVNILDIVGMVNGILYGDWNGSPIPPPQAYFNQDDVVNILDIVSMATYILGED